MEGRPVASSFRGVIALVYGVDMGTGLHVLQRAAHAAGRRFFAPDDRCGLISSRGGGGGGGSECKGVLPYVLCMDDTGLQSPLL